MENVKWLCIHLIRSLSILSNDWNGSFAHKSWPTLTRADVSLKAISYFCKNEQQQNVTTHNYASDNNIIDIKSSPWHWASTRDHQSHFKRHKLQLVCDLRRPGTIHIHCEVNWSEERAFEMHRTASIKLVYTEGKENSVQEFCM